MDSKINKKYNPCIVPSSLVKACARALQSGLDKGYKPKSYLDGNIDVYKNALYRHILSYMDGYLVDSESGLDILDHIVANVCILIELENQIHRDTSQDVGLPKLVTKELDDGVEYVKDFYITHPHTKDEFKIICEENGWMLGQWHGTYTNKKDKENNKLFTWEEN